MRSLRNIVSKISSVGRNLSSIVFNAFVFYLLEQWSDQELMKEFAWFLLVSNLFVTFTGWGLKDDTFKIFVQNMNRIPEKIGEIFSAKMLLYLILLPLVLFLPFNAMFKIALMTCVLFRTISGITESLVLIRAKVKNVFVSDLFVFSSAITVLVIFPKQGDVLFFVLAFIELARAFFSWVFIADLRRGFSLKLSLTFLAEKRYYFFVAFFGYFLSRVDVFMLGFSREEINFSWYSVLANLISVSQIVIAAIYNQSLKGVYRLNAERAASALNKLHLQFAGLSILATACIFSTLTFIYKIQVVPAAYLFVLGSVFSFCFTVKFTYLLNYMNRWNYFLWALCAASSVTFLGSWILIQSFGMYGAMAASCAGAVALPCILSFMIAKTKLPASAPFLADQGK